MERKITFFSSGHRLYGNLYLPAQGAPAVLLSHGLESSKDGTKWLALAPRLHDEGFACLRFNYRGCGEGKETSEGGPDNMTLSGRVADFKAALDFLQDSGVASSRIGVLGSSFGGMTALAAEDPRVKSMVLLATPYRFPPLEGKEVEGMQQKGYIELSSGMKLKESFFQDLKSYHLLQAAGRMPCPVLVIHGSDDAVAPLSDARRLYESCGGPKRLEIVEGGDHSFSSPEHMERIVALSIEWFRQYL